MPPVAAGPCLDEILDRRLLSSAYQPVVDLGSGHVVGHEALLRGPAGSVLAAPIDLLTAARDEGRLGELDLVAVEAAVAGTRSTRVDPGALFVNVEPSTLTERTDELLAALAPCVAARPVVVEITERALARDPAGMLAAAERLRVAGCALALDDVGVVPESLAFIPLVRPEVVKLDMQLLRTVEDQDTITVAGAVTAYAEESGAEIVAEGIETPQDLARATILGATLGQGWLWGRPGDVTQPAVPDDDRFRARPVGRVLRSTPFELLPPSARVRTAPKRLLLPVSRTVEQAALAQRVPPMLLSTFQDVSRFGRGTARRYAELAARLPFVLTLAMGMPPCPGGAVRGGALSPDDALAQEWTVTVLGAHECVALVARECPGTPTTPDEDRRFDFVVTHDRELVTAVAHAMVGRLT